MNFKQSDEAPILEFFSGKLKQTWKVKFNLNAIASLDMDNVTQSQINFFKIKTGPTGILILVPNQMGLKTIRQTQNKGLIHRNTQSEVVANFKQSLLHKIN